jgi:hypothetical protein
VTEAQATAFAATALANVVREYPRHVAHLLTRANEDVHPRKLHPAFYGSYDWHSAVHMHCFWCEDAPSPGARRDDHAGLDKHLTRNAGRRARLLQQRWARLSSGRTAGVLVAGELLALGKRNWSDAMQPLADELARRMARFVGGAPYPIRAGSHGNTHSRACSH